jgi:hypothetical protein
MEWAVLLDHANLKIEQNHFNFNDIYLDNPANWTCWTCIAYAIYIMRSSLAYCALVGKAIQERFIGLKLKKTIL